MRFHETFIGFNDADIFKKYAFRLIGDTVSQSKQFLNFLAHDVTFGDIAMFNFQLTQKESVCTFNSTPLTIVDQDRYCC